MSAEKSSKAVREQVKKINMEWQNVDDQWLRLYIHLNREMSSDISEVAHLLPYRRKGRKGVEAGMGSRECGERYVRGNLKESNWSWPEVILTRKDLRNLIGIALEISIKYFFENFTYTFGGEVYLQTFGGPIGARLTMCVARIVMQEWSDQFEKLLEENKIDEKMRGIYVDDGRSITRKLELGTRFVEEKNLFERTEEMKRKDEEEGITREDLTEVEILKAMNSINKDLQFTSETERDFQKKRLPTLSFEIWSTDKGIRHSYFEKEMRSQILTMSESSQPENAKYSILVNELNRRFEVMDKDISKEEKIEIIDHFTSQLRNSGYSHQMALEIIMSSLKGMKNKEKRRTEGENRYKSAVQTLSTRLHKKLTEAVNWYKRERDKEEGEIEEEDERKRDIGDWKAWRYKERKRKKRILGKTRKWREEDIYKDVTEPDGPERKIDKIQTVIFMQHTRHSELAKRVRGKLKELEKVGKIKVKIVERSGTKLQDLLHKSNVWEEKDCLRENCWVCNEDNVGGKKGQCYKKNIVYESYCITCYKEEERKKKDEKENEEKERKEGGVECIGAVPSSQQGYKGMVNKMKMTGDEVEGREKGK